MRKRKKLPNTQYQHHTPKGLQIALIFGLVVALLIGLSLIVKVGILISKSQFDGLHQFVIQVKGDKENTAIIFSPDTHKIAILRLKGQMTNVSLLQSVALPQDGIIIENDEENTPDAFIHDVLTQGGKQSSLNQLDKIKLLLFSQTVTSDSINTQTLTLPLTTSSENALITLATDQTLYKEAQTIAVVNGSGISGVGNMVATLLTHVGANVISVTTADEDTNTSSLVYTGDKTYTVKRLSHIFDMSPVYVSNTGIADITITIGKDKVNMFRSL